MMTTMDLVPALVAALATARLTRLITTDEILRAPRRRLLARLDHQGLWAYLVVCPWCISIYTGTAIAGAGAWAGQWGWPWVLPLGLAFSYVTGFLAGKEGE